MFKSNCLFFGESWKWVWGVIYTDLALMLSSAMSFQGLLDQCLGWQNVEPMSCTTHDDNNNNNNTNGIQY